VQRHLRDARHGGEDDEDAGGGDNQEPVEHAARGLGFAEELATVHAGFDEIGGDVVAVAFADGSFFPARLLLAGGGRKAMAATPSIMRREPPMTSR